MLRSTPYIQTETLKKRAQRMNAIHIISTAPFFARGGKQLRTEDFDLYCMALSALAWRKYNGKISLYIDKRGWEHYQSLGLGRLWDEVRVCVPDDLEGIDPVMFWAGGKLFALREADAPIVMIDTDFIVWKPLKFGRELIAAHREDISPDIYPPLGFFKTRGHALPGFDDSVLPLNTAFLYIPDNDFKEFYTSQAIAFMKSAENTGDVLRYMVFAEQRMAAMCAEYTCTPVKTLLDKDNLFFPQDAFTHLWGAKQAMRDNPQLRGDFLDRCRSRLKAEFPEYSDIADIIDDQK